MDCTPSTGSVIIYELIQDHRNQNDWFKGELFCAQKVVYDGYSIEIKGVFISSQLQQIGTSITFDSIKELKEKLRLCKKNEHLNVRKAIAGIESSKIMYKLKEF